MVRPIGIFASIFEGNLMQRCSQNLYLLAKRIESIAFGVLNIVMSYLFPYRQIAPNRVVVVEQLQRELDDGSHLRRRTQMHIELIQNENSRLSLSAAPELKLIEIAKTQEGALILSPNEEIDPRILEQMQKAIVPNLPNQLLGSFQAHMQAVNQLAPGDAPPPMPADLSEYADQRFAKMRREAEMRLA